MKILIATGNPSKVKEIVAVLGDPEASSDLPHIQWLCLTDLDRPIPEPVEDGQTLEQNAALKARYYSNAAGMWALADDSGLEVDALCGEPGVHSAYYARDAAGRPRKERDAANNAKLIEAIRGMPAERRSARFRCCLALADGDRILATAEGRVEGIIIDEALGKNGFGYDPHFFIPEIGKTTAELAPKEKNRISHRGRALASLRAKLSDLAR
jgi:XTP/dITP diphosphohydrolase